MKLFVVFACSTAVAFAVTVAVCFSCYFIKFILLERPNSFIWFLQMKRLFIGYDIWYSKLVQHLAIAVTTTTATQIILTTKTMTMTTTSVCEYDAIFESEYLYHMFVLSSMKNVDNQLSVANEIT